MPKCKGLSYTGNWPRECYSEDVNADGLCKRHAAGKRRKAAWREKQDAEREAINKLHDEASAEGREFSRVLRVHIEPEYPGFRHPPTGKFIISGDNLRALIAELKPGQQPPEKPEPQK